MRPVIGLALLVVLVHILTNAWGPYEFHRDEFLYLAMGRHLTFWKMDFPVGMAVLAQTTRLLFGETLAAIRFLPALGGGALVLLAAWFAKRLFNSLKPQISRIEGFGGSGALLLAPLGVALSPLYLRAGNLFQPVIFDQLTSCAAFAALVLLIEAPTPKRWLWLGLAFGVGLLVKFSIAFPALGIALAILLERRLRSWLATPWPWLAALVTLTVGSPSLVGQIRLGFPVRHQMAELSRSQLAASGRIEFLLGQLETGPVVVLGLIGAGALLTGARCRRYRPIAVGCVGAFLLLLAGSGKAYYFGPAWIPLAGAGAAAVGAMVDQRRRALVTGALTAVIVLFGLVTLPLGLPIVGPESLAKALARLTFTGATRTNRGELGEIPQDYADMLGWTERVDRVAAVYRALPAAERDEAVVLGANYGQAGAIDLLGPARGLPTPISPAGSFWHFGPGPKPGRVIITLGSDRESLSRVYQSVTVADSVDIPYTVSEERGVLILIGREPRQTLQQIWPNLANRYR
jgi:hypothetical protein